MSLGRIYYWRADAHGFFKKKPFITGSMGKKIAPTYSGWQGLPLVERQFCSAISLINWLRRRDVPSSCHYHFFREQYLNTCTTLYCLRSLSYQMAQRYDTFKAALVAAYIDTAVTLPRDMGNDLRWRTTRLGWTDLLGLGWCWWGENTSWARFHC